MTDTDAVLLDPTVNSSPKHSEAAHLADLTARATSKYSVKDYDAASDLYSQATELQAEINGEMSPQNADLLYAYGRCLYHLAVRKSDVLGSKVAGDRREKLKGTRNQKPGSEAETGSLNGEQRRAAEEVVSKVIEEKDCSNGAEETSDKSNKPYFQFTGDENWDTSDEEDTAGQEEEDEDGDEEDDFVTAFEILDLARVLLSRNLDATGNNAIRGQEETKSIRHLKERLADTYDLQAEISLEGERWAAAVTDLRSALSLKAALFPQESSLIAEAHYKLSLALEFSSVTREKTDEEDSLSGKHVVVDEAMREEAAREMEAAISSCKIRIQMEESSLAKKAQAKGSTRDQNVTASDINDVVEMVKEMEQRVSDNPRCQCWY